MSSGYQRRGAAVARTLLVGSRRMSLIVTGFTLAGYLAALLRERATAAAYGTTVDLDAFVVAYTAVTVVALTLGRALYDPIVVTLASLRERDEGSGARLARAIIAATGIALTAGAVLLFTFRGGAVWVVAPAMSGRGIAEADRLTAILLPAVVFIGLGEASRALLHGYEEFVASSLLPIANTAVVLGAVVLFAPVMGIDALAYGTVAGGALQLLATVVVLARLGVVRLGVSWIPVAEHARHLAAPLAAGLTLTLISSLSVVIDRALGSLLPEGRIAALNYASRLTDVATIAAATGIATVAYPRLARLWTTGQVSEFVRVFRLSAAGTLALATPLALALGIAAQPTVSILFGTGRFDAESIRIASGSLAAYALGIPFLASGSVVARALYARRRIRVLVLQGVLLLAVKATVGLALVGPLEHVGVALASTIASAAAAVFMWVTVEFDTAARGARPPV